MAEEEIDDVAEKEDIEEEDNENWYSEDDYHDSFEDELMCHELVRLVGLKGMAEPLWTKELEFAGMTRATCLFASKQGNRKVCYSLLLK